MGSLLLWLHVLAAATWFGAAVAVMVTTPRMRTAGGDVAAGWQRHTVMLGARLFTPAAVVALATGVGLVLESNGAYEWESTFVVLGFAMVIVGAFVGIRIYAPSGRRAAELHEAGETSGLDAIYGRVRTVAWVELFLLALTIYAMVAKLGT